MSEKEIKEMFKMSPGAILENYKFMQKELDKYKEVLDKIKPMLKELNIKLKDILNIGIDIKEISDILELLEEIE